MGTTPAAELARLKLAYRDWSIRAIEPGKGSGYTAQRKAKRGVRRVYAPSLAQLVVRIMARYSRSRAVVRARARPAP